MHFSMLDYKLVLTSMDPNRKLSKAQCPATDAKYEEIAKYSYIQGMGGILSCMLYMP